MNARHVHIVSSSRLLRRSFGVSLSYTFGLGASLTMTPTLRLLFTTIGVRHGPCLAGGPRHINVRLQALFIPPPAMAMRLR